MYSIGSNKLSTKTPSNDDGDEIRKIESKLIQERQCQGEDLLNKTLDRLYNHLQITNIVNDAPPFRFQRPDIQEKYLKFINELKVRTKYAVNNKKSVQYTDTLFPDFLKDVDLYLQKILKPRLQKYSDDTVSEIIRYVGLSCYLELMEAHIKVKQSNTELFCRRSYAGGTSVFVKALKNPFFLKDKHKKIIDVNLENLKKINGTDSRENWISIYKILCEESKEKLPKKLEKEKTEMSGTNRPDVLKIIPEMQSKITVLEGWIMSLQQRNENLSEYIANLERKFIPNFHQPQQNLLPVKSNSCTVSESLAFKDDHVFLQNAQSSFVPQSNVTPMALENQIRPNYFNPNHPTSTTTTTSFSNFNTNCGIPRLDPYTKNEFLVPKPNEINENENENEMIMDESGYLSENGENDFLEYDEVDYSNLDDVIENMPGISPSWMKESFYW